MILRHTDSTTPLATAQEAGAFAFGQASDMANFRPTPRINSILDDWTPYYIERVGVVLDGTRQSDGRWRGTGDGGAAIGANTDAVPAEVKEGAPALRDAVARGEHHPFTGPLHERDGTP